MRGGEGVGWAKSGKDVEMSGRKFVIVGGVAAGASAAARLRRLDEEATIVILEKGDAASYANCGLPYRLGGVIGSRDQLLVTAPEKFRDWFAVDLRCGCAVIGIDRARKVVKVKERNGREYEEGYDGLLLATGSVPRPGQTPGEEDPAVHRLWTLADMDGVEQALEAGARRALVVGAGFVGVETAENLAHRGLEVTVVQKGHVLPILDPEMSTLVEDELLRCGIEVETGCVVEAYRREGGELKARLSNGREVACDVVVEGVGVMPASGLARTAGLELGARGHVLVDEGMQTSDEAIWAAGDVAEVVDSATGRHVAIALAGPANKQGRIAAENMARKVGAGAATAAGARRYVGGNGPSVLRVGRLTVASAGRTEERLRREGVECRAVYVHPFSNATYYPGAEQMTLKLLFAPADGTILGCQIVGGKGVDKRIDVVSAAMSAGWPAPRLAEVELAYAPPYGSAKDAVNFAGFVVENVLAGLSDPISPAAVPEGAQVVDVREAAEYALGSIPGARNIPLGELRGHLEELEKNRPVVAYCQVGVRGYLAERILRQKGFDAHNLSGGYRAWKLFNHTRGEVNQAVRGRAKDLPGKGGVPAEAAAGLAVATELDVRGLACPGPVMRLTKAVGAVAPGERVLVRAETSFEADLRRWASSNGHGLDEVSMGAEGLTAVVTKGGGGTAQAGTPQAADEKSSDGVSACALQGGAIPDKMAIVVFSNDLDRALAALILANGFAAAGTKVSLFFTFWGLSVLRKGGAKVKKSLMGRLFGWMLPTGAEKLALSKLDMMGVGRGMIRGLMKKQRVPSLSELIGSAHEAGVRFLACDMAMGLMGLTREELAPVDEVVGVASFAAVAKGGGTLFI